MSSFSKETDDLLLAINGAEEALQIVLARREEEDEPYSLLDARTLVVPGRSVNFIIPSIRDSLNLFGYTAADVSKVALTAGPGSFTGLRLTFSAAAGFVAGNGGLIAGMEYLPILAAGPAMVTKLPVWTVTHSRRMKVYIQGFEKVSDEDHLPVAITPALPVSVEEAVEVMKSFNQTKAVLVGSGLIKNKVFFDRFMTENPRFSALPERFNTLAVQDLLDAAKRAEYSHEMPVPMYLRGSDAEENLEMITRKFGIPLAEARKRLEHITPR
ncbi:tRNA (adenosine(37)-N6)-threonylcarbamoyltransferase complex dimerization subunit type 1 TsaB [Maridesulfovibrio hydrothermalis]|uniref:Peptidase M22 glycoprotease n=1 Tax=Maridesulfovibrio hydrothermalis AM13 = DSM 14728 TaxID=1121451 RepID=L0RG51_9BACT|nr:tRNA (adenosine(37)-N6)-threonylcarbamoyltransferase complex dimerization subunit type 1 TsaB [Maridesulfovibrio hydrothermalis]CCO25190.1 Peptidase M22 glycoprotease [Maridesulfovibrio hydrothermalis AM13 = DSM 14728]